MFMGNDSLCRGNVNINFDCGGNDNIGVGELTTWKKVWGNRRGQNEYFVFWGIDAVPTLLLGSPKNHIRMLSCMWWSLHPQWSSAFSRTKLNLISISPSSSLCRQRQQLWDDGGMPGVVPRHRRRTEDSLPRQGGDHPGEDPGGGGVGQGLFLFLVFPGTVRPRQTDSRTPGGLRFRLRDAKVLRVLPHRHLQILLRPGI